MRARGGLEVQCRLALGEGEDAGMDVDEGFEDVAGEFVVVVVVATRKYFHGVIRLSFLHGIP